MKNEGLYKFEVIENIGCRSKECFGEIGTIWEMPKETLTDNRGRIWTSCSFENFSEYLNVTDEYQTKFKLVEPYKIDLCKIIGVEELQEFKVANLVADYKIKNNSLMFRNEKTDDWAYSTMYINDFIEFINEHEIEILPKFERLELNEHIEWYLKGRFENKKDMWLVKNINGTATVFFGEKPQQLKQLQMYIITKINSVEEIPYFIAKQIPLTFEMGAYSLDKHFESEEK